MKVTVCFGAIKVIVPCGEGTLSVGELIEKSIQRYKKATGRNPDYWVHVHSLASQSEGGILDIDDIVSDVADDREKLTAHFEEQDPSRAQVVSNHLLGDGTSTCASSVGTASPINFSDMNHINNSNNKTHHMHHAHHHNNPHMNGTLEEDNEMDVVVTGEESDSKLVVRRGSDPVITSMLTKSDVNGENTVIDKNANTLPAKTSSSDKPRSRRGSRDELLNSAFSRFGRDSAGSARQSLSSAHPSMNKWTDAQQKAENKGSTERGPDVMIEGDLDAETDSIVLTNDGTPLGVHIISKIEQEDGSAFGIVVHSIEAGGRAARDGRLLPGDYIVQINGSDISLHSFNRAQEMLRDAMRNPTVKLTVQRDKYFSTEAMVDTTPNGHLEITIPPKSPGGKVPPLIPVRSPTTSLSSPTATTPGDPKSPNAKLIAPMSTRRIGRKLYIQLMKGPQGLGFSVTSRDNPTGGKNPIFIKNILPKGAAISDGRLKPGDRLMEVNGIEMTGKSQSEAVSILRSVKLGGVVNLVVSRQDSPVKMVPRQLPEDAVPVEDPVTSPQNRAVMTFEIPLNDTGSAGLGVSVKGKTSGATEDHSSKDLGIFIKSVIHGGAASKDGRLRPNDQLLCINETSLANMSNSEAMETLRLAMSHEKSPRSTIALVIARRLDQQDPMAHTNNLNKAAMSPASDRNVDSGLLSPLPQKDGNFGMPSSLSDGVLSSRTMNGGMHRNEIVVHASVEPHHATSPRHPGAKVTYPGGEDEPIYTRSMKSSSGQTLPSSGQEVAMQTADASPGRPSMHLSIHSSPSARAPSPPQWLLDWDSGAKDGELSPLPDPDNFARDNYARASFSERRQGGSLDAKQMAWYKKTKSDIPKKQTMEQKDVAASTSSLLRASSMDSLLESKPSTSRVVESTSKTMGPGLGMEKSSSLESLEVAVASVHQQREDFPGRPRAKVRRGRVCNDSFRAAVDRSYGDQSPNGDMPPMYTVMEAEENGGYGISRTGSGGESGMQSAGSMKKKKDKKEDKSKAKSSGTGFKGLFRFGKNRKSIGSENALKGKDKDGKNQMTERERLEQQELESWKARQQAQQEHEKIQEEIHKLREAKIKEENQEALSKAEKMMQLRQQYQQRHRDNQGQYIDDGEDDDDEYTRVEPSSQHETMSQRERLEAARAEQRDKERQNGRVPERGGDRCERLPPEAEDRRKDRREDIYSEPKDRRDERTSNNRYSEDPYADPRNLRNSQDRGRYYDDRSSRRNDRDVEENPYDRYNGKKDQSAQESRDGRNDRNRDNRSTEPPRQERRRSLKRNDRVEGAKNKADARAQGKENIDVHRQEKRESEEKERERRPNERRTDYHARNDKSIERKNPKREDQRQEARRDDRYKDGRYDGRRDDMKRGGGGEGERDYESRDNRYDSRRGDDRYYDQGVEGGRRQEERRDRQPPRDERDRHRNVQQDDRHGYSSLDRPSGRRPRGKDPNYYSMSENPSGSRPDEDYSRTQNYSRYNNYSDHQQPPRRTSYPNGPSSNHTSHPSGPSGDRYRRANSTSDYLDYKEEPRRSKSVSDQLVDEYQYDSRRAATQGSRKGHQRPNDISEGRMYNDYDDAARV